MAARALVAVTAAYLGAFFYFIYAAWQPEPVYDFMAWVVSAASWRVDNLWGYLFEPHNSHRLVWSRILTIIDIEWTHGTGIPFAIFGIVAVSASLTGLVLTIRASADKATEIVLISAVVFCLATAQTATLYSMPANGPFAYCAAFAVLSILAAERSIVAAVLFAAAATFSSAGGLFMWPVLIWWTWRARRPTASVLLALCTATVFAAYLWHNPSTPKQISVLPTADYVVRLLGLPWSHVPALARLGSFVGAGVLCSAVFLLCRDMYLRHPLTAIERIGLGLLIFSLLVALAVAAGRVDTAIDRPMPIRYAIFASLAHLGLVLTTNRLWATIGQRRSEVACLVIGVVLLVQQIFVGKAAVAETALYRSNWSAFVAGGWTPDMEHYVYPDRSQALVSLDTIKKNGLFGQMP